MVVEGFTTLLETRPLPNFVETPFIKAIVERALTYIRAGSPVHFRGASGTGKTTLAMHVASSIGRPVVMIHGDEEFSTSDLVGAEYGYRFRRVIDNFIHSVLKTEEDMTRRWVDNRLTVAAKYGFTLIYDEFTRSRPEANNVLLWVLQERMLDMPASQSGENYLRVHPDFAAIFTSNPAEYAGVFRSQDALRDRMVTIDLGHFDEETEISITQARSGLERAEAEKIIRVVRGLRECNGWQSTPSVRRCIMVGQAARVRGCAVAAADPVFRQMCQDILASEASMSGDGSEAARTRETLNELIDRYC
jgi:gas vesicle protein GvpN